LNIASRTFQLPAKTKQLRSANAILDLIRPDTFIEFGFLGLFLASFLAATILPLSSEVVLCYLLMNDYSPVISTIVATAGNVSGSFTNYAIGYWGSLLVIQNVLKISLHDFSRAKKRFEKYGVLSLCFAWIPVIGDPLTLVAGVLKINVMIFLFLVTAGKLCRYIIISMAIL